MVVSSTLSTAPALQLSWRVHLCTTTPDQEADEAVVRGWLHEHGCVLMAPSSAPDETKLEAAIAAARACDLCLLLLGPTFGVCDALSSFSHAELEVSAAADVHPDKVLIFERSDAISASSPEQREFHARMRSFSQGAFQATYLAKNVELQATQPESEESPEEAFSKGLRRTLDNALRVWEPPQAQDGQPPRTSTEDAIMISSTSDLWRERARVHSALVQEGLSVIDYLSQPSQSVRPVDLILSWAHKCRALVLILNEHYGSISPLDGLGITELEFVTALRAHHPILALMGPRASTKEETTPDADQRQFVERVLQFVPPNHVLSYDEANLESQLRIGLRRLFDESVTERLAKAPVTDQLRWYHRQVQRWLGTLPHLLQPKGMPLEQVYVSLAMTPLASTTMRDEGHDEKAKVTTFDADEALRRFPRMVLQGDPGTGKTVALRWYAINTDSTTIPVYIRLGAYAQAIEQQRATSLVDYIRQEEHRFVLSDQDDEEIFLLLLRAGRGVILLDGLDEVSTRQPTFGTAPEAVAVESLRFRVARDILALAQQFPATPIVVATRSLDSGADQLTSTFTTLRVQPLNPTQQRQVVLQWLYTAHPDHPLTAVQTTQEVLDTLQAQHGLQSWAATPLMLVLLTALIDSANSARTDSDRADNSPAVQSLSKATLLRRAIRLLLGQWSTLATRADDDPIGKPRLGAKHLWPKEKLLVQLAWDTFLNGRRQLITEDDMRAAWLALPQLAQTMGDESTLVSELSGEDGFLPQVAEGQYVFYHSLFQEYLSATMLGAQEVDERLELVARKRLDARWEETTQLLVDELDRLRRWEAADEVVLTLITADRRPLAPLRWSDPAHFALRRAARAQGARISNGGAKKGAELLAAVWSEMLQQNLAARPQNQSLIDVAFQAFLDMGSAAVNAAPLLQDIVREFTQSVARGDQYARFASSPIGAIEALGNCGTSADAALLAGVLERGQGIGEPQAAALRGLLRLGPDAVRPHRELLSRFVWAQSAIGSRSEESGDYAAALLIHLEPTKEDIDGIARLHGRWRQEAMWVAPQLPLAEAIPVLREGLSRSSLLRTSYAERSDLDFRGDTLSDDRYAALAACAGLRDEAVPLLPNIIYRSVSDTLRNRRLAESIIRALGCKAVAAMTTYIEERCRNEEAREQYFGRVLSGLQTSHEQEQIRSLLSDGIRALRLIAEIQDRQRSNSLHEEQAAGHIPKPYEGITSVPLDQLLTTLRSAAANDDPLIRQAVITLVLDSVGHMGPVAAPALDDICVLTNDPQQRRRAIAALAGLGLAAKPALPILQEALADPDMRIRAYAIDAIGQLGEAAIPSLPALNTLLARDKNADTAPEVRRQVILAWGRLWPLTRPYLQDILNVVQTDQSMEVRVAGVELLGQVADGEVSVLDVLHALTHTAGSYSTWYFDLRGHAKVALEQVLRRVGDAEALTYSAASAESERAAPDELQLGWLRRLSRLFFRH